MIDFDFFDENGYPTEEYLNYLRNYSYDVLPIETFVDIVLRNGWYNGDWGFIFKKKYKNKRKLELHTGGWSGCEEVISVLKSNFYFWIFWRMSKVGGHYYFEIPVNK